VHASVWIEALARATKKSLAIPISALPIHSLYFDANLGRLWIESRQGHRAITPKSTTLKPSPGPRPNQGTAIYHNSGDFDLFDLES